MKGKTVMKKTFKRSLATAALLALTFMAAMPVTAEAKAKVKLSKTKATLTITDKKAAPAIRLKVKNAPKKAVKKAVWKSSNKKVATVDKSGKVVAKAKGKATVTVKVNGRKLSCKVTVADKRKTAVSKNPAKRDGAPGQAPSKKPAKTPTKTPAKAPEEEPVKCDHEWEEHWAVLDKEGTCGNVEFMGLCKCGRLFLSETDFQMHLWSLSGHKGVLSDLERKCGVHGSEAKSTGTTHGMGDITYWSVHTEYIDYMQCTKCGERIKGE